MRGTIEKIEEKKTKTNKVYHLLTIDDQRYSFWDADKIGGLELGTLIEFDFVQKGDFRKLSDFTVIQKSSPSTKKNEYNDSKTWNTCLMSAKDIMVALINSTTEGKEMGLKNIQKTVIKMGLAFYQASENGVVEKEPEPEEDIPMDFDEKANQSVFDSFNYQLINTKWKDKEELAAWWAAGQKAMLKMTEDERKHLIKTYSEELGKIK